MLQPESVNIINNNDHSVDNNQQIENNELSYLLPNLWKRKVLEEKS
jgi:hypothetical protein